MRTAIFRTLTAVLVTAGSVFAFGPTPSAAAGELYVTDFQVWWPNLVWTPNVCQSVTFNWHALTPTLEVDISTRNGQGRPVNMSGGKYPYTSDELLGIGIPTGGSGYITRTICGPATAAEARDMQLWAVRDMYTSQAGGSKESWRPLYAAVDEPPPGAPGSTAAVGHDRSAHVTWTAPLVNAQFLASYSIVESASGTVVCTSDKAALACDVADLADGAHSFVVSALNAAGGGTASSPSAPITVAAPKAPPAPSLKKSGKNVRITWSTDTGSTAYPSNYQVLSQTGKQVCSLAPSSTDLLQGYSLCAVRNAAKGSRFRVVVTTGLGTATSALSKPLK